MTDGGLDRRALLRLAGAGVLGTGGWATEGVAADGTAGSSAGGVPFELAWTREVTPSSRGAGSGWDLTYSDDADAFAVTGWTDTLGSRTDDGANYGADQDSFVAALRADGDIEQRYVPADAHADVAGAIAPRSSGGYLLGFSGTNGDEQSIGALAVDAGGSRAWRRTYGSYYRSGAADAVAAGRGHLLAVNVQPSSDEDTNEGRILRITADGGLSWQRNHGLGLSRLAATPDGAFLAVGRAGSDADYPDGFAVKVGADGEERWARQVEPVGESSLEFRAVAAGDDQHLVLGQTESFSDGPVTVLALDDDDGSVDWRRTYQPSRADAAGSGAVASAIVPVDDDRYLVGASVLTDPWRPWLMAIDGSGDVAWSASARYGGSRDVLVNNIVVGDGAYVACGAAAETEDDDNDYDDGERGGAWAARFRPGNERPSVLLSVSTSEPAVGEAVEFDAGASEDPDGSIRRYEWDLTGDGTVDATGETVTHAYEDPGSYRVTLTAVDGDGGRATASTTLAVERRFLPERHAFPFTNWATAMQGDTFDPDHDHGEISQAEVRRHIDESWEGPFKQHLDVDLGGLPESVVDGIARQVYTSINQGAATGGHCFGMVLAASEYYEDPDSLPGPADVAGDVPRPTGQYDGVGDDIDAFHNTQHLNANTWLRTWVLTAPSGWSDNAVLDIDYDRNFEMITSALEGTGTAPVGVYDTETGRGHQLLVHDVDRQGDRAELSVYDPNRNEIEPNLLAVDPGTTVTFAFHSRPHRLEFREVPGDSALDAGPVDVDDGLHEVTLETPGLYIYHRLSDREFNAVRVMDDGENVPDAMTDRTDRSSVTVDVGLQPDDTIAFDTGGGAAAPDRDGDGDLYLGYDRLVYVGEDDVDVGGLVLGGTQALVRAGVGLLGDAVGGLISFFTKSPISIEVTDAQGEELGRVSSDFVSLEPTEYEAVRYRYGESSGEYAVEATGEDTGEYTVEVYGASPDGATIEDSVTRDIEEGTVHSLSANVPDDPETDSASLTFEGSRDAPEEGGGDDLADDVPGSGLPLTTVGGGVGGAGLVAGGYAAYRYLAGGDGASGGGDPIGDEEDEAGDGDGAGGATDDDVGGSDDGWSTGFCPDCGADLVDGAKFCPNCGREL